MHERKQPGGKQPGREPTKPARSAGDLILVLGGAASGKSTFALTVAEKGVPKRASKAFLATGQPLDDEMADRISRHRRVRGTDWVTAEVPLDVEAWFRKEGSAYRVIVLDCVTLWLSNLLGSGLPGEAIPSRVADLLEVVRATGARVVVVSNELGFGLVPADPVSREFRDLAGRVNQQFAAVADEVYLVVAGLATRLK